MSPAPASSFETFVETDTITKPKCQADSATTVKSVPKSTKWSASLRDDTPDRTSMVFTKKKATLSPALASSSLRAWNLYWRTRDLVPSWFCDDKRRKRMRISDLNTTQHINSDMALVLIGLLGLTRADALIAYDDNGSDVT